jgi:hypothetical protein
MVVVGGNDNPVWNKEDPFPKGLGIFSLNTLEWKDSFEADSATYQGPSVVREWYDERLVTWSSTVKCTLLTGFQRTRHHSMGK